MTAISRWRPCGLHTRREDLPISAIISISPATAISTGCRPVNQIGAHAAGWNDRSIGICYEGGLDEAGTPSDTRTYAQKCSLLDLLRQLRRDYPEAKIVGHCQLSPYIRKACPCFDAREEYAGLEEEVSRK